MCGTVHWSLFNYCKQLSISFVNTPTQTCKHVQILITPLHRTHPQYRYTKQTNRNEKCENERAKCDGFIGIINSNLCNLKHSSFHFVFALQKQQHIPETGKECIIQHGFRSIRISKTCLNSTKTLKRTRRPCRIMSAIRCAGRRALTHTHTEPNHQANFVSKQIRYDHTVYSM